MIWVLASVSVLALIFLWFAVTFWREMLKKFKFHEQFTSEDGYHRREYFLWKGNKKSGMRNIVIKGTSPFRVLVSFNFPFGGIDSFGENQSYKVNDCYYVVVSTFLWDVYKKFIFEINSPSPNIGITVRLQDENESRTAKRLPPNIICKPHWFQRLHIWA